VIVQVEPDETTFIYQLFELVSRGSYNLGVFGFAFLLQGYYRVLDGGITSALRRVYLTFHLIGDEGKYAVKLIGEATRKEMK
jgi:hypothetical protein